MLRLLFVAAAAAFLLGVLAPDVSSAQSTSNVFGPVVDEGHVSAQHRIAYSPDNDGLVNRLHYQRAINGDFRWRIIGQARKTDESNLDFDFVQGELLWDLREDGHDWRPGLRLDVRVRDDDRPGLIALNWVNQIQLSPKVRARATAISSFDVGDDARDGMFLQTRGHLRYSLPERRAVGVEMFNRYGSTADFADFEDQRHQIGPFVTTPLPSGFSLFASALFGVTESTSDTDLRIWTTRRF